MRHNEMARRAELTWHRADDFLRPDTFPFDIDEIYYIDIARNTGQDML